MTDIVKYQANDGQNIELDKASIQKYVATGSANVSDADMVRFMALCQARKLNPLAGDCYLTTYKRKDGTTSATVQVSKDYYTRVAAQKDSYDGCKAGIVVEYNGEIVYREGSMLLSEERLLGGWAEVYDKRRSHPCRDEVSIKEYDTGKSLWESKPATMIRKVALVHALREMYPGDFGGIYDDSETDEPVTKATQDAEPEIGSQDHTLDNVRELILAIRDKFGKSPKELTAEIESEYGCKMNELGLSQITDIENKLRDVLEDNSEQEDAEVVEAEYYEVDVEF